MPTIGEVYNPLVNAAITDSPEATRLMLEVGKAIFSAHPTRCSSLEEGIKAAKDNLDYYCQYFDEKTANKVKEVYGLGSGFRDLAGNKHNFK